MPACYPTDCVSCMRKDGPSDRRFRVDGGTLLYNSRRDARFPYLYRVPTHSQVHSPEYIKKILIHIVDTADDARIARAKFDKTLSVPLGPNALMEKYGSYLLPLAGSYR